MRSSHAPRQLAAPAPITRAKARPTSPDATMACLQDPVEGSEAVWCAACIQAAGPLISTSPTAIICLLVLRNTPHSDQYALAIDSALENAQLVRHACTWQRSRRRRRRVSQKPEQRGRRASQRLFDS